ncbi:MAG: hypothetical protein SVX43_01735 [Cyanobacteriota bacterium]|nr:hypothetical protein [Cyanobacteriota bacterium]
MDVFFHHPDELRDEVAEAGARDRGSLCWLASRSVRVTLRFDPVDPKSQHKGKHQFIFSPYWIAPPSLN